MNNNEVLHPYSVFYRVAAGDERELIVEAIDAVDAKHLVESLEGEVVVAALARKMRTRPTVVGIESRRQLSNGR